MITAAKFVQCVAGFSRASLSPATMLRRGLTSQVHPKFISLNAKDREAAVKVDVENRRTHGSKLMNKTKLKPAEVDVGNGQRVEVLMSAFSGIFEGAEMPNDQYRPIYLDEQATAFMGPRVVDAWLSVFNCSHGNRDPRTQTHRRKTRKAQDVAHEYAAKINGVRQMEIIFTSAGRESNHSKHVACFCKYQNHVVTAQVESKSALDAHRHLRNEGYDITYLPIKGNSLIDLEHLDKEIGPDKVLDSIIAINNKIGVIHPMGEIGKLCCKQGVYFHTADALPLNDYPVDGSEWNVDLARFFGYKFYVLKGIGACYIFDASKFRIGRRISGGAPRHGLRCGMLMQSLGIGFGETCGIAQQDTGYTCQSQPFFSQNSICPSTIQEGNYIHTRYHNKQPHQFSRTLHTKSYCENKADMKGSMLQTTTDDSIMGIPEASPPKVGKTRTRKLTTSYSNMTLAEAEMRLKVPLDFRVTPIKQMLEGKSGLLGPDAILKVKGQVYENLVGFLEVVGYPTDVNLNFNEVNINDMVGRTIYPVLVQFKRETMRELYLTRERLITSKDSRTSGIEEFAVMDYISLSERKYILVVEAKKVSDVDAGKHCFLVLKDMRDFNGGGTVYGFVTMGDYWKMITYDGEFKISEPIGLLFETMGQNEKQWMANYSILVDCFNVALSHGEKDRVEIV